jgi:AbrB family looped-hinge helix DNA binding protein
MKINEKGQVTIPAQVRKRMGYVKDTEVQWVEDNNGLRLVKSNNTPHPVDRVYGILKHPIDVDSYMEELRGR